MAYQSGMPDQQFLWDIFRRYVLCKVIVLCLIDCMIHMCLNLISPEWTKMEAGTFQQMNFKWRYPMGHGVHSIQKQYDLWSVMNHFIPDFLEAPTEPLGLVFQECLTERIAELWVFRISVLCGSTWPIGRIAFDHSTQIIPGILTRTSWKLH